jgi:hypothetical protein
VVLALLQLAATSPSSTAGTQALRAPLALAGAVVWLLAELLLATLSSPPASASHSAASATQRPRQKFRAQYDKGAGSCVQAQVLQLSLLLLVAVFQLVYAGAQAAVTANHYDAPSAHWSPALLTEVQRMARTAPAAQVCSGVALVALLVAYVGNVAWATCGSAISGSICTCRVRHTSARADR